MSTLPKIYLLLISWLLLTPLKAQDSFPAIILPEIKAGDTIFPGKILEPVTVTGWKEPQGLSLSSRDKAYLRKVYPYALRIGHLVETIEGELAAMKKNKNRKQYIRDMEKMLKEEFTDDVKDLTRIQGQMLTKLVCRETNATVYELIKRYKSGFSAGWWNLMGKFYDQDLKLRYEPEGVDKDIERYVLYLDNIYQRNGLKENIQNEQFTPSIQGKKRTRKRG
jgi:hypothetical protein